MYIELGLRYILLKFVIFKISYKFNLQVKYIFMTNIRSFNLLHHITIKTSKQKHVIEADGLQKALYYI